MISHYKIDVINKKCDCGELSLISPNVWSFDFMCAMDILIVPFLDLQSHKVESDNQFQAVLFYEYKVHKLKK